MGGLSLPHLLILALVVLVLFGRGRISEMMGDFGKGIKSFKQGMSDETDRPVTMPPRLEQQASASQPLPAAPSPAVPAPQAQSQGQGMIYDPVTAPPTTDPNPPHPAPMPSAARAEAPEMPFDPVTAPPTAGNAGPREG